MKPQEELTLLGKQLNNLLALLERVHEDHDTESQELFHIWRTLRLQCAAAWERHAALLEGERPTRAMAKAVTTLLPTPPRNARRDAPLRVAEPEPEPKSAPVKRNEVELPEVPEELTPDEVAAEGLESMPVLRKKPRLKRAERDLGGNPVFDEELAEVFDKGLDSAAAAPLDELQKKR